VAAGRIEDAGGLQEEAATGTLLRHGLVERELDELAPIHAGHEHEQQVAARGRAQQRGERMDERPEQLLECVDAGERVVRHVHRHGVVDEPRRRARQRRVRCGAE
jgi:hypothetical protein